MTDSPLLAVQPDWPVAISERDKSIWVNLTWPGRQQASVHSILTVEATAGTVRLHSLGGFTAQLLPGAGGRQQLHVAHPATHTEATFASPTAAVQPLAQPPAGGLDVSPGGQLAVVGGADGGLVVFLTDDGSVQRRLEGHVSSVDSCRFFPSGKVVLSADLAIRIWDVDTGDCAATFGGHTQGITDTAIVDRGRNIISVSRDGSARLWDCGRSAAITTLYAGPAPINSCALAATHMQLPAPTGPSGEREVGSEGKLLLLAGDDACLRAVAVQPRQQVVSVACGSAVQCCSQGAGTTVAAGTADGTVLVWDLRSTASPLQTWALGPAAITALAAAPSGWWVATGAGHVQQVGGNVLVLTGPDTDPVRRVCVQGHVVYTWCRDGLVRKYVL